MYLIYLVRYICQIKLYCTYNFKINKDLFSVMLYIHHSSASALLQSLTYTIKVARRCLSEKLLLLGWGGGRGRDKGKRDTYHFCSHFIGQCASHRHDSTNKMGKENHPIRRSITGKELGDLLNNNISTTVSSLKPQTLPVVLSLVLKNIISVGLP